MIDYDVNFHVGDAVFFKYDVETYGKVIEVFEDKILIRYQDPHSDEWREIVRAKGEVELD